MVLSRFLATATVACTLAFAPTSINAQDKSQLVGAWSLVSFNLGTKPVFGSNPKGTIIFDATGRYAMILVNSDREKKWTAKSREGASGDELAAAARGLVSQFGQWEVVDGGKTLVRKVEGALNPALGGREQRVGLSVKGDELRLSDRASGVSGGDSEQVYRRVK